MSYKTAFSQDFDLGFKIKNFPVELIDKSYRNDICPSFYFKIQDQYFVLWVNYKENNLREDPNTKRYIITHGVNLGDNEHLEIYDDSNKSDILMTDSISEVESTIRKMLVSDKE
ncbi:hypothetical protein [Denitrificimonas caeni]|uniref:hypothetical protein n=1 Tax=Denitrificimonas caeni TaxID=521720 RepID=UPI0003B4FBF1|nr:hypothetical protein [Denitrificimonas caeni]